MKTLLSLSLVFLVLSCSHSQDEKNAQDIVERSDWPVELAGLELDSMLSKDPKYRFQMVYTPFDSSGIGQTIDYRTNQYYYPASLVKIPLALITMEILEEEGISWDSYLIFDTVEACGSVRFVELSRQKITFDQLFKELIVVSDNHFYNMLYHFVTPEQINQRLHELGFQGTHIYRAFTGCDKVDQLHTYPYKMYSADGNLLKEVNESYLDSTVLDTHYEFTEDRLFGSKHENAEGDIVEGPYDLNFSLEMPLNEIHEMVLRLMNPNQFKKEQRFRISDANRKRMVLYMMTTPKYIQPSYRSFKNYDDTIYKYAALKDRSGQRQTTISKLGLSYGFASEVVYLDIPDTGEGFLLSYSIYVNENDIVNDGDYEYEEVARPFAMELSKRIANWQMQND